MLFTPDYKTEIIGEAEFPARIAELETTLAQYAVTGKFESFDGCPIAYEYYLCENSRASVIIIHGFTEFARKYRELAWYFMRMGYNVFIYDQRGHGHSGRSVENVHLAHVDSFYDYVRDLEEFTDKVVTPAGGRVPLYLYSHSMGGAVAALYLSERGERVQKAVLSSPMICPVTHGMPRKMLMGMVKRTAEKVGWSQKFKYAGEFTAEVDFDKTSDTSRSRFEYNLKLRVEDIGYQNSSSTNRWIHEALAVQDALLKRSVTDRISADVLILSAEKDTVVRSAPQQIFASMLPHGRFIRIAGAKHSIYNSPEPILGKYIELIMSFFGA